jgi:hypothetical protein
VNGDGGGDVGGDVAGVPHALRFLSFELSEDTDGVSTLDAEASTPGDQAPLVMAEVQQVLGWARQHFAHTEGPVDEGQDWDHVLHTSVEPGADHDWHTVALTFSASPAFVAAFRQRFGESVS